jgi:hypothetical protein
MINFEVMLQLVVLSVKYLQNLTISNTKPHPTPQTLCIQPKDLGLTNLCPLQSQVSHLIHINFEYS